MTTLIIPYVSSLASGDELRYALRSWAQNFDLSNVVIIGDRPTWISDSITHIPHKRFSTNPQIDVADKIYQVCNSDIVSEKFIWSNDDIYLIKKTLLENIEKLRAMGVFKQKGLSNGIYRANSLNTMRALSDLNSVYDYATHTPFVFEKAKMKSIIEDFKCREEGHLISTLYFNTYYPEVVPHIVRSSPEAYITSIWTDNKNKTLVDSVFRRSTFINNNDTGWNVTKERLKVLFPQRCKYEHI